MATTYYVSTSGSDSANGTSTSTPWQTITKVNGFSFAAGDNIYFKSGETWTGTLIPKSGSGGNYVTYGAYGTGVKPRLSNTSISGKTYIKIQGIKFSVTSGSNYPLIISDSSTYIWVDNCEIYAESGSTPYAAARIYTNSNHNKITNCTIEHRNLGYQSDALNLKFNANYNLIEGNTIGTASHYALTLEGANATYPSYVCSYNVIRNNTITNPQGAVVELQSRSNRNLVEGNIISGGKATSSNDSTPRSFKLVNENNIIRKNVIKDNTDNAASGLSAIAYQYQSDPANNTLNNRIYNNTITTIKNRALEYGNFEPAVCTVSGNTHKNNIVYSNGSSYQLYISSDGGISNNYFMNNIFYNAGVTNVVSVSGTARSVAGIQSADPTHFYGNLQVSPNLDTSFQPQTGSPAIDAGTFLTTITSTTGSGTSFVVADARYFSDGFGIVTGDTIQIGSNIRTISSVNYTTNAITVTSSVSWTTGMNVSLPYNGTAPDIGAYEYVPSGESTGKIKGYVNGSFKAAPVKFYNGTTWKVAPLKVYESGSWKVTPY